MAWTPKRPGDPETGARITFTPTPEDASADYLLVTGSDNWDRDARSVDDFVPLIDAPGWFTSVTPARGRRFQRQRAIQTQINRVHRRAAKRLKGEQGA